jgi:glycosyltransferase involved in cell wall biosynthesis
MSQDLNHSPLVSVVIPMYNEEQNIGATLNSLVSQSYSNIQLILVDDCSTDDTINRANSIIDDDTHVILENVTNMGQTFSMNRGAMHIEGKYVIFHDADDVSTKDRIRKQVSFLEENQDVGVVGGAFFYQESESSDAVLRSRPTSDGQIRRKMARECMINAGTAMYRREALLEAGLFKSEVVEGYELMVEIGKKWKLANLPDPIYFYRINQGSRSNNKQYYKKAVLGYRSYQAIRKLGLSYWQLLFQFGWLIYMNSPNKVQKIIRRVFSPTEERTLSVEEKRQVEELLDFYND